MYEMMRVKTKPPLHGGAAFGVAYKDLMPSLRNKWNSEAYDEDLRVNRKLFEKTAAQLAAADESEPIPPLRLRAVLTEIAAHINEMIGTISGANIEMSERPMRNRNVDLSSLSTEWNRLVAVANPLLIGPVNVGMNDEDTNALHNMITNQLLEPLMNLQAVAYEYKRRGGQITNEEAILSDNIAQNIMLQVKDKYYKPVPYGAERRAGPGMAEPGGVDEEPPEEPAPAPVGRRKGRAAAADIAPQQLEAAMGRAVEAPPGGAVRPPLASPRQPLRVGKEQRQAAQAAQGPAQAAQGPAPVESPEIPDWLVANPTPPPRRSGRLESAQKKKSPQKKGNGRWTDYAGPQPAATPRRSYGSGSAGAKARPRKVKSSNDPLYFHDSDNDVCETGEGALPDEMLKTEIREAHLDPDWKGLPKRWGAERRYKKLRKGNSMPKEKY